MDPVQKLVQAAPPADLDKVSTASIYRREKLFVCPSFAARQDPAQCSSNKSVPVALGEKEKLLSKI